jgi:hypothetical protein
LKFEASCAIICKTPKQKTSNVMSFFMDEIYSKKK